MNVHSQFLKVTLLSQILGKNKAFIVLIKANIGGILGPFPPPHQQNLKRLIVYHNNYGILRLDLV